MSTRLTNIEAWVLDIVARVKAGTKVEDARVELKRRFPDHVKAARRIAGHANSCFGSDILWIIGLDEEQGVNGSQPEDLANWWPSVCSHFDGVYPALTDLIIPIDGRSLVCLFFEPVRPPYVVKNPNYGSPGGGAVEFEVPWREGTSVRSATRNDLIRLLVPTIAQPEVEFLGGNGRLTHKTEEFPNDNVIGVRVNFNLTVYIYPHGKGSVVIPFHKCECIVSDGVDRSNIDEFEFIMHSPYLMHSGGGRSDTVTIERTSNELIAHGPGKCSIQLNKILKNEPSWFKETELHIRIILFIIGCELPVEINVVATPETPKHNEIKCWKIHNFGSSASR